MIGALPEFLEVGGEKYPIRSDYRNVLQVFEAFADPELEQDEKWIIAIYTIFQDFRCADDVYAAIENGLDAEDAVKQINWFINAGKPEKDIPQKPTYDWEQDEQMIFSAVNKVAGREVRSCEYMHWWTFLGYFHEIGEGIFSYVVNIRSKRNHGKKLDKSEKEFLRENPTMIELKERKTAEQIRQEAEIKKALDKILGL